jgi:hypothetical protein
MSNVILSTPTAMAALQRMQAIVQGGLSDQIRQLCEAGDVAGDPTNWEGPHAARFRATWADSKSSLHRLLGDLVELQTRLARVQHDIQAAGGAG